MRVEGVELRLLSLHLAIEHRSAAGAETERPVVLVRALTGAGEGWGECVALAEPTYAPEYAAGAYEMLRDFLVPALLEGATQEVREGGSALDGLGGVRGHHMAKAALEMALIDAGLRTAGRSFAESIGVEVDSVPAGGVAGLARSPALAAERVEQLVDAGYRRVKVKIAPGADLEPLRTVRERFPELPLQADANGAYRLDADDAVPPVLEALDELALLCLEQPLPADDLVGHAVLSRALSTPLCLDESITSLGRLDTALALAACRVVCVKPGPLGGLRRALAAHDRCRDRGVDAWVGGLLETGLGRAVNAALAGLAGFTLVGDIGGGRRFVEDDPFGVVELDGGRVPIHRDVGVGPAPDPEALRSVTVRFDTVIR